MDIILGTTPTVIITVPSSVDLSAATIIEFSLVQRNTKIFKRELTLRDSHTVSAYLTQQETLRFTEGEATIQLNWTYADGSRGAMYKYTVTFIDNQNKEVIE